MIPARVPSWWSWGAFLGLALAASVLRPAAQWAFAAGAIGLLGLPHGASDLALIPASRRASFLAAYGVTIVAVLEAWMIAPTAAFPAFLALSAVHFAIDGLDKRNVPANRPAKWGVGLLLVAGPALFHGPGLAVMFEAIVPAAFASTLVTVLRALSIVALSPVIVAIARHERVGGSSPVQVATALAATLALPPLIGFACGFVLLHARGQTIERQRRLGCATLGGYLGKIAPVLAAAALVLAAIVAALLDAGLGGTSTLFAVIAALAVPHMTVTPLWVRATSSRKGPSGHRSRVVDRSSASRSGSVAARG